MSSIEADLRLLGFTVEGELAEHQLDEFADQIRDEIRELAPVFGESGRDDRRSAPPEGEPGDFKESITTRFVKAGHRRVGSDSEVAIWQEIGTRHFPELAIFTKVSKLHGGTSPVITDEGVERAHSQLRGELEKLAKLTATGAAAHQLAAQRAAVNEARGARSAAFRAARGGSRGRGRGRRR